MSESESRPDNRVWIYKGSRKLETYIYLGKEDDFDAIPAELLKAMGSLEFVMTVDLDPGRTLARANPKAVLEAIDTKGFYLQLPPVDRPGESRVH